MTALFLKIASAADAIGGADGSTAPLSTNVEIGDALLIALLCFCVIMFVLASLIGIIFLLRFCINKIDKTAERVSAKKTAKNAATQKSTTATVAEAKGSSGGINIFNVAPKDAAMIMAIVADELKMPLNRLKFKSIKLIGEVGEDNEVQG